MREMMQETLLLKDTYLLNELLHCTTSFYRSDCLGCKTSSSSSLSSLLVDQNVG
jgi:hypothetical protein